MSTPCLSNYTRHLLIDLVFNPAPESRVSRQSHNKTSPFHIELHNVNNNQYFVIFSELFAVEPSFDVPVVNITAVEQTEAILPCSVTYLGGHKVC